MAVDLDSKLYNRVSQVVSSGNYASLQQFLEAAAWNQLTLEEGAAGPWPHGLEQTQLVPESAPEGSRSQVEGRGGAWKAMLQTVEPEALSQLVGPPIVSPDEAVLWGQTNRVLPIAVGVRVLAHLLLEGQVSARCSEWHKAATGTARQLRRHLEEWDRSAGRKRGELWATAFPQEDEGSRDRYVSQFLGVPRKNGVGEGGAAFLGFVAFDGSGDSASVRLTTSGASWVGIPNPIFDGESPSKTFNAEEAAFFIDHLQRYCPGEYRLLAAVSSLVARGRSRTEIDDKLAEVYPTWRKYVGTMRAGAIGRLYDLGLLARKRRGLQVDYHLTDLASELGLSDPLGGSTG